MYHSNETLWWTRQVHTVLKLNFCSASTVIKYKLWKVLIELTILCMCVWMMTPNKRILNVLDIPSNCLAKWAQSEADKVVNNWRACATIVSKTVNDSLGEETEYFLRKISKTI